MSQMPATTVKVDEADKQKLEKLQALITLRGKKVTQQELLSTLISEAVERSDELVDRVVKEKTVPMSIEDFQKILSLSEDWGFKSKWQDIDQALYGQKSSRKAGSRS
jgi:hypothetical protein